MKVARRTLTSDIRGYAETRLARRSYTATAAKPSDVNASVHLRVR